MARLRHPFADLRHLRRPRRDPGGATPAPEGTPPPLAAPPEDGAARRAGEAGGEAGTGQHPPGGAPLAAPASDARAAEPAEEAAAAAVEAAAAAAAVDDRPGTPVYRGEMLELVYSRRQRQVPPWAEASDRELLLALRADGAGAEDALDELIGRKTKPLLQLVSRILGDLEEARDVVQVTFFKVWENRRKFDERWSPNTWIYRIASNLAIDHLRARRSRERSQEPVRQHLRQVADGRTHRDLSRVQQSEVAAIFRELAASLSVKQRLVFLMREVEGLSSPEVAGILHCRESTVRNHLFNARKYLRGELLRRYPEYAAAFVPAARSAASAAEEPR